MKRLAMSAIALLAIGAAAAPAAGSSERRVVLDQYCADSGDYCLAVKAKGDKVKLQIASLAFSGAYKLCVKGPVRKNCNNYALTESGEGFADNVNWNRDYGYQGAGVYLVTWKFDGVKLGKTLGFQFEE